MPQARFVLLEGDEEEGKVVSPKKTLPRNMAPKERFWLQLDGQHRLLWLNQAGSPTMLEPFFVILYDTTSPFQKWNFRMISPSLVSLKNAGFSSMT